MKKKHKGFTYIELLIALAVAVFLITITLSMNLNLFQNVMFASSRSVLAHDNLMLANYLRGQAQAVGGGSVLSWMAMWIENNCVARGDFPACNGSDRVTFVTEVANSPNAIECTITSSAGYPSTLVMNSSPTCCVAGWAVGQSLMLVQAMTYYASVYITNVNVGACTIQVQPGQAHGNDNPTASWQGSVLSPGIAAQVNVSTYFMTPTAATDSSGEATWGANELLSWTDSNNDGEIASSELTEVADNVYDLQAAFGVDTTQNSVIIDAGSNTDNWLYNSPGESWLTGPFATLPVPPPPNTSFIREIGIGIVSGVPLNSTNVQPAAIPAVFDGPVRSSPGVQLRSIIMKATPRNNYIFQ